MLAEILSPDISQTDESVSSESMDLLRPYITGDDRSLIFFVGAGASSAGGTQMPTTQAFLQQILLDAFKQSEKYDNNYKDVINIIRENINLLGFEITLNDLWQICGKTITLLYSAFAKIDERCATNCVHAFLAHWLSTGGIVLTTNYDLLIEREWHDINDNIDVRYQDKGSNSFSSWSKDLERGSCLFKLHGSLDNPDSCLGALEHVRTQLTGPRAELLADLTKHRPLCFVGWSGSDPDIPPLLSSLYKERVSSLPVFWIHYEGKNPGANSIQSEIGKLSPTVRIIASEHPILTDANRAFRIMLNWQGIEFTTRNSMTAINLDFSREIRQCSPSGATRFVGIALRRAGQLNESEHVLETAIKLSGTEKERSAALQEIALVYQQRQGSNTDRSRKILKRARNTLIEDPDLWLQLNLDFGLLSMTITTLQSRPWLLLRIPFLFRKYKRSIEILSTETTDKESVALHSALMNLYLGRTRLKLFGWLGGGFHNLAVWIIQPFNVAHEIINDAKDIHLHSRIDVLSYRASALARFKLCKDALEDVDETDRLVLILKDNARSKHWNKQRQEIEQRCISTDK